MDPAPPKPKPKATADAAPDTEEEQDSASATVSTASADAGGEDEKKRRGHSGLGPPRRAAAGGVTQPCCQAEHCTADLREAKRYHRRHKVCELHSKAAVVIVSGLRQRFCQQCSRFHELSEFDETKRSCRRRLAGHNERRRKNSSESQGEGSSRCRQPDQGGRIEISVPGNPTLKHFQIR